MSDAVIARAPVRISFAGGGTDLPEYADRHGGLVVSAAVARCSTVIANPSFDGKIGVNSADYRCWLRWPAGVPAGNSEPLSLPRAVLGWFSERGMLPDGIDLFLAAEVPPGSGLGSSSAMAVALVKAISGFSGQPLDHAECARLACHIEIERLGRPIGRQDQHASAFGGINAIAFSPDRDEVTPLNLPPGFSSVLRDSLILLSTGHTRDSATILDGQRAATGNGSAVERLHRIKALAVEMKQAMEAGDLAAVGALLDEGWRIKRGLATGISSSRIDLLYAAARDAGALGGKIAGAGGGGFLLLCAPPERHPQILDALAPYDLAPLGFDFDWTGVRASALHERAGDPLAR
jgi:D-glycero-alpha-D-manno-heptose-7-phosphate kinase